MSRATTLLILVSGLILAANTASAQGVFVTANAGYSLGAATQSIGANITTTGLTESREGVYGSLGEGGKFGVSVGYMFNPNLAIEFGFSYWLGKSFESTNRDPDITSWDKWSASGFVAVPSVVVSTDLKPVNPYARFGLIVGILRPVEEQHVDHPNEHLEATFKESGNVAVGWAGALGIVIPTGGSVDFFTEVVAHALSYSPGQSEITRYVVDGVDRLPTLANKTIDYEESYTTGGEPTRLAVRRAFSSVGILVGIRLKL